jgi:hypothetical protein
MRIHLLTLKDLSDTLCYRAYASTDSNRSDDEVLQDICWQLGYQPDHPGQSDVHDPTREFWGTLVRVVSRTSDTLTLSSCGEWVRVAVDASGYISSSYPVLAEQELPESEVGQGYCYTMIPFYPIQPNLEWDAADNSGSDSDSDSD